MPTVFTGNAHRNIIMGSGGDDEIYGFDGNDDLYGSDGRDLLKGGGGDDYLDGGFGYDIASFAESTVGVNVNLQLGFAWRSWTPEIDTLVSIEDVLGSPNGDVVTGNNAPNWVWGENGPDILFGMDNDDRLYGGNGGDELVGGEGSDFLDGGDGDDWAWYGYATAGVSVTLMPSPTTGMGYGYGGEASGDTLYRVEKLGGSLYADELRGDDNPNMLQGLDGNDRLVGNGGRDQLWGGWGTDQLDGGGGTDTFFWSFVSETGLTNATADVIFNFNGAEGDLIDLSSVDANSYVPWDQNFTFIGTAPFTLNAATPDPTDVVPGEIRYYHLDGSTYLELQTGTSADIEGVIRLDGILTPTASWFVL